jgi:hypothetical protein
MNCDDEAGGKGAREIEIEIEGGSKQGSRRAGDRTTRATRGVKFVRKMFQSVAGLGRVLV